LTLSGKIRVGVLASGLWLGCSLLAVGFLQAADERPFFMLYAHPSSRSDGLRRVLIRYFTSADYLAPQWRTASPELSARIPRSHAFSIPAGVERAKRDAADPEVGLVMLDVEHWDATPAEERSHPEEAIRRAEQATHAVPDKRFGITPDGQFIGLKPGQCEVSDADNIARRVDLPKLDVIQFQAQRLLGDTCAGEGGVKLYERYIRANAEAAKAGNPKILVVAQFSFRYSPPEQMIEVIHALEGVADGYYLAYPDKNCDYCSPENLEKVLAGVRK
jgi:hypothetical protein